jgi:hypothetical protein
MRSLLLVAALLIPAEFQTSAALMQQENALRPAVPTEPIRAVLEAFRDHPIVALGEGAHGNEQGHAVRLALIRHPMFAATVNDIVVEFGNALFQNVIDRFIAGEDVPYAVLRQVWENTTQPHDVWDKPIYEELFREVRRINRGVPRDRQVRVLLGDPPIDWNRVKTAKDLEGWDRDGHAAQVIRREVLDRGRRALIVYGDLHFLRHDQRTKAASAPRSIVRLLEQNANAHVFSIHSLAGGGVQDLENLQPGVASWPAPSLAMLRGTVLGAIPLGSYYTRPLSIALDGSALLDDRVSVRIEEQFDAVLYLGAPSTITMSRIAPARCADAAYMQMRLARMALLPSPPGFSMADRLKEYCAKP